MAEKLLHCPFCGGVEIDIDEMEPCPWDGISYWRVMCINCCGQIACETEGKSIAAWNRRALEGEK